MNGDEHQPAVLSKSVERTTDDLGNDSWRITLDVNTRDEAQAISDLFRLYNRDELPILITETGFIDPTDES